jgi:hypothetical protein
MYLTGSTARIPYLFGPALITAEGNGDLGAQDSNEDRIFDF